MRKVWVVLTAGSPGKLTVRRRFVCGRRAGGAVRGSHPGQGSKGQLRGVTFHAVTAKASSPPSKSPGAGMSLQSCPKLRQGTCVYTPALACPRKQAAVGKQSRAGAFPLLRAVPQEEGGVEPPAAGAQSRGDRGGAAWHPVTAREPLGLCSLPCNYTELEQN